jgi:hypothetical protein
VIVYFTQGMGVQFPRMPRRSLTARFFQTFFKRFFDTMRESRLDKAILVVTILYIVVYKLATDRLEFIVTTVWGICAIVVVHAFEAAWAVSKEVKQEGQNALPKGFAPTSNERIYPVLYKTLLYGLACLLLMICAYCSYLTWTRGRVVPITQPPQSGTQSPVVPESVPSLDMFFVAGGAGIDPAFNFINRGETNLYVWGDKIGNGQKLISPPPPITITRNGGTYHIWAREFVADTRKHMRDNGDVRIPFLVFVSSTDGKKYVLRYVLWMTVKKGNLLIETQNRGATEEDFTKSAYQPSTSPTRVPCREDDLHNCSPSELYQKVTRLIQHIQALIDDMEWRTREANSISSAHLNEPNGAQIQQAQEEILGKITHEDMGDYRHNYSDSAVKYRAELVARLGPQTAPLEHEPQDAHQLQIVVNELRGMAEELNHRKP